MIGYRGFLPAGLDPRDRYCDNGHELVQWHHDGGERCFVCRTPGVKGWPPPKATSIRPDHYETHYADQREMEE